MSQVHSRFDLEQWTREFPLAGAREAAREQVEAWARQDPSRYRDEAAKQRDAREMQPGGDIIVGPASLALAEQLRREAGEVARLGRGVPVDVMVWGRGEPAHPAATKIGGTPHRPADQPWPRGAEGRPSEFIAQICFADSRDILLDRAGKPARLPGDVLLIFAPNPDGIWDSDEEDPTCLQHEWWPLDIANPMRAGDVPEGASILEPCFAELHRSFDSPEAPDDHPLLGHSRGDELCVFQGGKIGGVPFWVQEADPPPGMFLASVGSINPVGEKYPLMGVPRNPDGEFNMEGAFLMFGDCGALYLFQSEEGVVRRRPRLHWTVQGY